MTDTYTNISNALEADIRNLRRRLSSPDYVKLLIQEAEEEEKISKQRYDNPEAYIVAKISKASIWSKLDPLAQAEYLEERKCEEEALLKELKSRYHRVFLERIDDPYE